jgi:type VI secretion system Hcp family effector
MASVVALVLEAVMRSTVVISVLAVGVATLFGQAAFAQISNDAFMLIPGVPGEALDDRYREWIEVQSLSQGFEDLPKGVTPCDLAIQKQLDKSGPLLFAAAITGQIFPQIQIDIVRPGSRERYYEIVLTNARVSRISSAPQFLNESLSLIAETIRLSYFPQRQNGSLDPPIVATASCK